MRLIQDLTSCSYTHFFTYYTRFLMKRRFRNVYVKNDYVRETDRPTLFYGNHCYWWDALTPLVINKYLFKQDLKAVMEKKQIEQWPFFAKIGAIGIEIGNLKSLRSLLTEVTNHLNLPNSCLWLYPEGKIVPITQTPATFQPLIALLIESIEDIDIVCVSQYIDYSKSDKADLYIHLQEVKLDLSLSRKEKLNSLSKISQDNLTHIVEFQYDNAILSKLI